MENYREKLKISNRISSICVLVLFAFILTAGLAEAGILQLAPVAGDSHWQSMWRGFCCGASCGILALMVFGLVRNHRAIKNDTALKKLYIKEHDERAIQIRTSAQAAAQQTFLWVGMVAVVVSGYFHVAVSLTILVCIFILSILSLIFIAYYNKKF